jgi:general secretion pathway protein F
VLERLADYTENREVMRQKVLGALLYPIVLTVVCFAIVSILLVFVVPKVTEVFDSYKAELPLITKVLIGTSNFFRDWGIWLLLVLPLALWFIARQLKKPEVRARVDRAQLRVPIVGRIVRGFNTARFTRTLSILSSASVPVLEALRIAGTVVTNLPMREAVATATLRVREGAPIGRSLGNSRMFPPMTIHLISSGESSGQLDAMLDRAAQSQERELDGLLTALLGLLGPLLIIVMGMFVVGIVFAMLLPIFQMNNLIR